MRIKNVLVRATVTGVLTATAGVGAAITATPASALPRQCTSAQIQQLQQNSAFWWDEAFTWVEWADYDATYHDWDAYGLDVHNEIVAKEQAIAAEADLRDCL